MSVNEIAYQNKDIASKVFAERFRAVSLSVYGLDLPKIVRVLPTNLPEISANELRIDNLFLLEDGRIAIIDYESEYKEGNHLKYLGYIHRILKRYFSEGDTDVELVMIVIYTGDVKKTKVKCDYYAGCVNLHEETVFLSELNSNEIRRNLSEKIKAREALTNEEIMEFIILPLSYNKEQQGEAIENTINMAKEIKDENTMIFVLSGILVFTDKVIDNELSRKTKEWIAMTKVGRLFLEEAEEKAKLAEAKQLIKIIEAFAKNDGITIAEACTKADITFEDYEEAKKLVNSSAEVA